MFRKVTLSLLAAVLVAGTVTAVPASAATKVSNGVACSKANATTKVSGYSYKCAKNILVKNSKLTWLSVECITAMGQYTAAIKARTSFGDQSAQVFKLTSDLNTSQSALDNATKSLEDVKAAAIKLKGELGLATGVSKSKLTLELTEMNLAISKLSAAKTKLSGTVSSLKTQKALLETTPSQLDANVKDTKSMASVICSKGL